EVKIDFTGTGFTKIGTGTKPTGWTGAVAGLVVTYTHATGLAPDASVTFVPTVTNPKVLGVVATNPEVLTSDEGWIAATLTTGTEGEDEISYVAVTPGADGNLITIAYVDPTAASASLSVDVDGNAITVNLATDGLSALISTAAEVVAAITADAEANLLVTATTDEVGGVVAVMGATNLAGGLDAVEDSAITATGVLTIIEGIYPTTGPVTTKVTVAGIDAPLFSTVTLYWENFAGQVLGTASVDIDGAWSKTVTIPSAITGNHYIVADDGTPAGFVFAVTASLSAGR
ncbi:unnamed protein product, partial [marine sediment metagenome]